ncbi:ion channel [Lentibacter algarum]|uniref:ion channel n=1 Tax=Lentibacter algarum TaxID=576131 RepID=UPI0024923B27|nr:ion channel [Lentibacter algarum]
MRPEITLWATVSFGPFIFVAVIFAAQDQKHGALMIAHFVPQALYIMAPMSILAILFLSLGGKRNSFPIWLLITGIVAQIATYILAFSFYFAFSGLAQSPGGVDLRTAFYFSVVTWTTLGYGDLQPLPEDRLIAAFAAFMGYFYMAILTGLCIVGFSSATARQEGD